MNRLKRLQNIVLVVCSLLLFFHALSSHAQVGKGKGKIYFKDGSVQEGKIRFKRTKLSIRDKDSGKKIKIDPEAVASFMLNSNSRRCVFAYTNASTTRKNKYYTYFLVNNGEKAKLYTEETKTQMGPNSFNFITTTIYFVHKSGEPYAKWVRRPFVSLKKRLKKIFSDCPDLVEKIDSEGKRYRDVGAAVQYYNTNCGGSN